MKKYAVALAVAVASFIFTSLVGVFANDIFWDDIGGGNLGIKTVLVYQDNPRIAYIGTKNSILKTEDAGETWRNILSVKGQSRAVNFLLFDQKDRNSLYSATGNGLFYSANQGKSWNRIFQGKNYLENECTVLAILPATIYLGTKGGLFFSRDKGRHWYREKAYLGKGHILAIACDAKEPNYIYVACQDGVFKTKDAGQSWERVFVAYSAENNSDIGEKAEEANEEPGIFKLRYLAIDPRDLNCLYLATSKGVYRSPDRGQAWELISSYGLLSQDVRFLLVSARSRLYATAGSGVFEYTDERWQELSLRLLAEEIAFLSLDSQGNIYAACDKGLFRAKIEYCENKREDNSIPLYYKDIPGIAEIQQVAIQYAEVEPEKIIRWRKQAAKKAWLPELSASINRNATDLWHWEGGSTTKADDDVLRKGKDALEWDVGLSWDLSGLVYNDDQTSIDVRSKLMVELRDNILDEVTKLYFERIRSKMELDSLSIEDRKKRLDKELKIQELTASLDALTGGYFSKALQK